jgi:hypothetical protein
LSQRIEAVLPDANSKVDTSSIAGMHVIYEFDFSKVGCGVWNVGLADDVMTVSEVAPRSPSMTISIWGEVWR